MSAESSSESGTSSVWSIITSPKVVAILAGIVAIALFMGAFIGTGTYLGSRDEWDRIKKEVNGKIWPLTMIGGFFLFIASAVYMIQDERYTMYYALVLCCLSLSLSYSALSISVLSST